MERRNPKTSRDFRVARHLLALVSALGLASCFVATEPDAFDAGCGDGTKRCGDECVSTDDPQFGCARNTCSSCALRNAQALCDSKGECGVAACEKSFENCDGDASNGCETDIDTDVANCGSCDNQCSDVARGQAACGAAACYVRLCDDPFEDCDGRFRTGCETDTSTDPDHCGSCDKACGDGQTCVDGECV